MYVHLTLRSRNRKTGPIPVSTTSADTCPSSCPLKDSGCYAKGGPLAIFWRQVSNGEAGGNWRSFLKQIAALPAGTLWRHNQAGDLAGKGDQIDTIKLEQLTAANGPAKGFTYTHKPLIGPSKHAKANREAFELANAAGFTVNASANSASHADQLVSAGIWPVVTVLPADTAEHVTKTPAGHTISVCPATYREDVSCQTCGLCARQNRTSIVGFPAHGASARKASSIAQGE